MAPASTSTPDARAEKVAEIAADRRIALHAYDGRAGSRSASRGGAVVHADDARAEEAWRAARPTSRSVYGTQPAPGDPLDRPDAFRAPADAVEIDAGRENFRVVEVVAERLETLWLAHDGHRRARFGLERTNEAGRAAVARERTWLVP